MVRKNYKPSQQTKQKTSKAMLKWWKENRNSNKVKIRNRKLSQALKNRFKGTNNPNYGKKYSKQRKLKISKTLKNHFVSENTKKKIMIFWDMF